MGKTRFAFILCIIVNCQLSIVNCAHAQQTFTDRLQQSGDSAGRIVLYQDKSITDLVNNVRRSAATPAQRKKVDGTVVQMPDSTLVGDSLSLGPKVKISGFRIQVYFGDNSRKGKAEARYAGTRFRTYFPNQPIYVSFVSPHWKCQAGDFRTREEANEVLRQIREMGIFREAVIVKSKINVRM